LQIRKRLFQREGEACASQHLTNFQAVSLTEGIVSTTSVHALVLKLVSGAQVPRNELKDRGFHRRFPGNALHKNTWHATGKVGDCLHSKGLTRRAAGPILTT
jgi:hypothetical protein